MNRFFREHKAISIAAGAALVVIAAILIVIFATRPHQIYVKGDWVKVYESAGAKEAVVMRFDRTGGPFDVGVKVERYNRDSKTWEPYGEEFSIHLAREHTLELPEAQKYRVLVQLIEGTEGKCLFLFTPSAASA